MLVNSSGKAVMVTLDGFEDGVGLLFLTESDAYRARSATEDAEHYRVAAVKLVEDEL